MGNLLDLAPIDLEALSLPAVGVTPLDLGNALGVQFLGFSIANFSVSDTRLSVSWLWKNPRDSACWRAAHVM